MPLTLHPDIARAFAEMASSGRPLEAPPVGDVSARREATNAFFKSMNQTTPLVTDVETQDFHTTAQDGHQILCRWFAKRTDSPLPGSAVLYTHGGGMISLSVDLFDAIIKQYVSRSGVPFLAVAYRLAPEFRAPTQVEDLYAGLRFLIDNAQRLGIDKKRIAIMGESAGGGLTASLAHYVNHRSERASIVKQILVYPMLDDRTTHINPEVSQFVTWTVDDNKTGWSALLGGRANADNVPPIHAAGRMTLQEAKNLPSAYIDVGELDLFADEGMQYAQTLSRAGVGCEFHLWPNVPHGFEGLAPNADITKLALERRVSVLKSI